MERRMSKQEKWRWKIVIDWHAYMAHSLGWVHQWNDKYVNNFIFDSDCVKLTWRVGMQCKRHVMKLDRSHILLYHVCKFSQFLSHKEHSDHKPEPSPVLDKINHQKVNEAHSGCLPFLHGQTTSCIFCLIKIHSQPMQTKDEHLCLIIELWSRWLCPGLNLFSLLYM